jgi:hypothetical protein
LPDVHQRVERHDFTVLVAHVEPADLVGLVRKLGFSLEEDFEQLMFLPVPRGRHFPGKSFNA